MRCGIGRAEWASAGWLSGAGRLGTAEQAELGRGHATGAHRWKGREQSGPCKAGRKEEKGGAAAGWAASRPGRSLG